MKYQIKINHSAEVFHCREDQHLLQGMQTLQVGLPLLEVIPVGCRGGGCGVCRVQVIEGSYEAHKMSCKHITEQDRSGGTVLACRVFPRSDLTIVVPAPVTE